MNLVSNEFSIVEQSRYHELKERCKKAWVEFAESIIEIRDSKLYKIEYNTFEEFCTVELELGRNYAYKLIASAEVLKNLENVYYGTQLPETETQTRPLTKLEPELQPLVWANVVEENENITAKKVEEAVYEFEGLNEALKNEKRVEVNIFNPNPNNPEISNRLKEISKLPIQEQIEEAKKIAEDFKKPHVSNNSGENEWYTPEHIIERARAVLGNIDLDPASCELANETVKAENYYTKEDDGLENDWYGNIWLNPPYAQPLIKHFSVKVRDEDYEQAIVLVNNATETEWFRNMFYRCAAICFTSARIKFIDTDGNATGSPLQGQAIFYVGGNKELFAEKFSDLGIIVYA
jgi:ParB family chromosome partitioning protein